MSSAQKKRKAVPEIPSSPIKDQAEQSAQYKTPSKEIEMPPIRTAEKSAKKKAKRPWLSANHPNLENKLASLQVEDEAMASQEERSDNSPGPSTPLPSKRDRKGKRKASPEPEEPTPAPAPIPEEDSGSELSDIDFIPLDMEAEMVYVNKNSRSLIRDFSDMEFPRPNLYFLDHMAPYRAIMKEAKRAKDIDKGAAEIKAYIVGKSKCKLLVATSGKEVTIDTKRSIAFAIERLTGEVP